VVRLEFVAGPAAQAYLKEHEADMAKQSADAAAKEERDELRDQRKEESRKIISEYFMHIPVSFEDSEKYGIIPNTTGTYYTSTNEQYDEYFHINFGEKLIKANPSASYCGIFEEGDNVRVIAYSGEKSKANAGAIVKEISEILDGSGGGNKRFGQGGGKNKSKKEEAKKKAESIGLE
jgi:alanyl-tRNA synthetase